MQFAVGYQLAQEDEVPFSQLLAPFRPHIREVYFPWLDMPSGRSPMTKLAGFVDWDAQRRLEDDLRALRQMGIRLDLLLNANCYGRLAISEHLGNLVCSVIAHLQEVTGLDLVTTTSPFIAKTVKGSFPEIEVRASVNMRIGTVKAMEYMADLFDSYYVQREYNRDPERIAELKKWADAHGKGLCILVNSGCLNFCSGQTFHDNLVAHEDEISATRNIEGWNPSVCWRYYQDPANWVAFLQNSWIRPEDTHRLDPYFLVAKLATRMHANPRGVIRAYTAGRYDGNLVDLFEPGHGSIFAPYIIDNARFPDDWFQRTTQCSKRCYDCDYCSQVLETVLTKAE